MALDFWYWLIMVPRPPLGTDSPAAWRSATAARMVPETATTRASSQSQSSLKSSVLVRRASTLKPLWTKRHMAVICWCSCAKAWNSSAVITVGRWEASMHHLLSRGCRGIVPLRDANTDARGRGTGRVVQCLGGPGHGIGGTRLQIAIAGGGQRIAHGHGGTARHHPPPELLPEMANGPPDRIARGVDFIDRGGGIGKVGHEAFQGKSPLCRSCGRT